MWRALSAEKDEVTRAVAENDKKVVSRGGGDR